MLLRRLIVHVPAQEEIDADLNEYGHIGNKCRAAYGHAAIEAGAPDKNDLRTNAVDAIANILHAVYEGRFSVQDPSDARFTRVVGAESLIASAVDHFYSEIYD